MFSASIYSNPKPNSKIQQGDIFVDLPLVLVTMKDLSFVPRGQGEPVSIEWTRLLEMMPADNCFSLRVPVIKVNGIVISQNCDASRDPYVSLCVFRNFEDVDRNFTQQNCSKADWFAKNLRNFRSKAPKWFYLPPDPRLRTKVKQAVDFAMTLSYQRTELESLTKLHRTARLNSVAERHFRESLAHYFHRYPVDDWYSFDGKEFEEYRKMDASARPFPEQMEKALRPRSEAARNARKLLAASQQRGIRNRMSTRPPR